MFLPNPRLLTWPAATLLTLAACVPDETGVDDANADADSSDGDGDGESTEAGQDEGTDEFGDTDTEPLSEIPALGIQISQVEANQGTAVIIAEGGEWVAGPDRLGPLISKRNTLVRVHYTVDPGWVARDIQAQLTITASDGTTKTFASSKTVDGDSMPNSLSGTFFFGLVAEAGDVEANSSFRVTLQEVDEAGRELAASAGLSEGTWQSPSEPGLLGIQPEPLQLKVVFVPFHHKFGGIDRLTDTSDATMQVLADALYEQNPTHELIWSVHEPMTWEYEMTSLGAVMGPMSALRENEQAFPNEYWAGLFPIPNGGVAGVAGIASVPSDGKGEGAQRVSVTALGNDIVRAAEVDVHEVGHTQGLAHVYCPYAEAASPDPAYPYANGLIGQWGFGILSFQLYSPDSFYDYMTYCNPTWVSTWSWDRNFYRIRTLTSWEGEAIGPEDQKPILMGSLAPDGSEFWWTVRGSLPSQASPFGDGRPQYLEFHADGDLVATRPSVVHMLNDFETVWVMTELPEELAGLEGIDTIVRIDADLEAHPLPAHRVTLSARPRTITAD
ncbi:hypothetical protein ACNOYE_19970 [Nannocystaceae bacterium ST9]